MQIDIPMFLGGVAVIILGVSAAQWITNISYQSDSYGLGTWLTGRPHEGSKVPYDMVGNGVFDEADESGIPIMSETIRFPKEL